MRWLCDETARRLRRAGVFGGLALMVGLFAEIAIAQTQEQRPAEQKPMLGIHQTFYLQNATRQADMNDIQTDLRNMLSRARIYGVQSQSAISVQGSAEDLAIAKEVIQELDRPQKVYRLTYTIAEMEGDKRVSAKHYELVLAANGKGTLKQGKRVPLVTGAYDIAGTTTPNTQVQYQDVGLSIQASLDGESLHTKVEQTSLAEEKSGVGAQDPIVQQMVLDNVTNLTAGKTFVLGSLDIPGGTRHEEIAVAWELVK